MNPSDFLGYLIKLVPNFEKYWRLEDNYSINDDGSFSFHGICTEFSHYFRDQEMHKHATPQDINWGTTIPDVDLGQLFNWLEENVEEKETAQSLKNSAGLLSNAICTCFLENISQTNAGEYAKRFMGKKCMAYFEYWHVSKEK